MLPDDLPEDMPSFVARFGSDEQCREYLFEARSPDGFRCSACGHDDAYALRTKIVYECVACRKQHSLLAGTIFEQTKTGLAKWFLAIYLVTSSKGGIAATELRRQLGLGSYQTAWTWLHKLRKAMVRPDRLAPGRARRGRRDLRRRPAARQARPGAAGKTLVAGAVEAGRGEARGRRLGRLRLAPLADASAASLDVLPRRQRRRAGDRGHRRLARLPRPARPRATTTSRSTSAPPRGDAALRLPAIHLVFSLVKRWLLGTSPRRGEQAPPRLSRRVRVPLQPPHRQADQPSAIARLVEHAVRIKPISYRVLVAPPAPA